MKKIFFDLQRFADIYNAESNTLVSGTSDNDSIYNEWNDNVTIDAGDGSDTISNYNGSNVSISAGAGDDEIDNNGGDSVTINAGDGNDYIRNDSSLVSIDGGKGDDYIRNDSSLVSIDGGKGDDEIDNNGGDSVTINAGDGNDYIRNYNSNVTIEAGVGKDTIENWCGSNVTIDGGEDNDFIENWYDPNVSITAGAGDDTINNEWGSNVTIEAGKGNDTISLGSSADNNVIVYNEGDGSDKIIGFNDNDTLKIADATYSTQVSGKHIIVTVGEEKISLMGAASLKTFNIDGFKSSNGESITNNSDLVTINAGAGDDTITNEGSLVSINAGAGNDSISNGGYDSNWNWHYGGNNVSINAGAGDDSIYLNDGSALINYKAGDGNDLITGFNEYSTLKISGGTYIRQISGDDLILMVGNGKITLQGAANLSTLNIEGKENKLLTLTEGDDTYSNTLDGATINALGGNDSIYNSGSEVSIDAGAGNDTIYNTSGWYATIDAGDGNDFILSQESDEVSINAGSGDDTIYISGGSNVTINAGEGNDSINSNGSEVSIDGGAGNDTIYNEEVGTTISGGAGADVFIHNVPKYDYSTDCVEITDYEEADTIKFEKYAVTKVTVSDSDVVFKTDDVKLKLKNAADKLIHYIDTDEQEKYYRVLTDGDDTYTNTLDNAVINPLGGNDLIRGFNATSTLAVDGDYRTAFALDDLIVTTSVGSVTLEGVAASLTTVNINGEEVYMNSWHLDGTTATYGSVAETLVTLGGVKSLGGISLDGNTITVAASALNKMLVEVSDGYTLKLGSDVTKTSSTKDWTLDGTTVSYKQTVTEGYKLEDNSIVYSAPSVTTLAEIKGTTSLDGISGSGKTIKLAGSALSNNVTVSGDYTFDFASDYSDATITGSDSDDTIITRGKNISLGAGAGNDSIKVLGSTTTVAGGSGSDVFAFKSSKGKNVVADYSPEDTVSLESGAANISMSGKDVIFTVGKEKVTVEGSKDKVITYVDATKEPQTYYGHDEDVLIDEKKITLLDNYSEDEFNVADYGDALQEIDATAVMLDLSITGNKFMNKITAGAGNDTLDGGKGNDTLTGGDGSDVFVYANGGGNDVVTDYAEEDTIKISKGSIKKISKTSSGSVVFTVGSGKLTLKDVGDKVVAYEDAEGVKHFYPVDFSDDGESVKLLKTYGKDDFNINDFDEYKSSVETIDASAVKQDLNITGNKLANVITGGKGNDSLDGGKGNDTLTGGEGSDVFVYANGGGNDVVTDYAEEDTIKISKGSIKKISKTSSGSVVFTVGSGKLTLKDVGDKVVAYEDAEGVKHFYPVDFSDDGESVKLLKTYGKDDFNINDFDEYKSSVETIDASKVSQDLTITGNKLANVITAGAGNDSLDGGKGNDTLTGGDGSDVFVYANGGGNDFVTDYDEEDTIKISKGSIKKISKTSSGSVVFTVGSGKLTVKDVGDKVVAYEDAEGVKHFYPVDFSDDGESVKLLKTYGKDDFNINDFDEYKSSVETIDASAVKQDLTITGNKLANVITAGAGNDSLDGGKGNDTLTGGEGSDVFVYANGSGNDVVTDYAEEDTIKISKGSIKKISKTSSGSVVFTVGSGKLTVKDVDDKVVAYEDADGVKHFYPVDFSDDGESVKLLKTYGKDDFNVNDYDEYKSSVETIDASAVPHDLNITGNKLANVITGTAEDDYIDGQEGSDTLLGGKGNDELYGGKGNDYLDGGAGDDSLWGGTGSDTLLGGAGDDTFIYQDGDGKDVIADYEPDLDTIMILSGEVKSPKANAYGDVTFKIGSKGQITFTDSANKYIELVDTSGNVLKQYTPK